MLFQFFKKDKTLPENRDSDHQKIYYNLENAYTSN